jgi:hypothetical protein
MNITISIPAAAGKVTMMGDSDVVDGALCRSSEFFKSWTMSVMTARGVYTYVWCR